MSHQLWISPVLRENSELVAGHSMQKSCVNLAAMKPSLYAPSAGDLRACAQSWSGESLYCRSWGQQRRISARSAHNACVPCSGSSQKLLLLAAQHRKSAAYLASMA